LRTAPLKEARAKREKGAINAAQLAEVEDREIEKIIKKQEDVGLKVTTDGEFRRSWWHFDFYGMLDGVEIYELDHGIQFQGVQTKPRSIRIHGKLGFSHHPMIDHFKFLKAHTRVMPKMCIPSPATMHFRLEPNAVTAKEYKDRDAIFEDLARTYRQAIRGFYSAVENVERECELVTLRVAGNEAAFQFRLTVIAGESRMLIEPIDVMAFGDDGKVTAMKAYWSADNVTQL